MTDKLRSPLHPSSGFTLIEMSIVLVIIAVITAGGISMGSSMIGSAQKVSTNNKLDAIETALMGYRVASNRLPCPADPALTDVAANTATYGYESGAAGTCGGGSTVSATFTALDSTTVVEGAVPVRTLGLPDEFQFDGWGRKFAYAVWTPLTAVATNTNSPAAFIQYGVNPSCGAITVQNAGHGTRTAQAAYALLSYGPDGHGGYLKGGTQYNVGASMTNVDELANAHYSTAPAQTTYSAIYVQKEYSTYATDNDSAHPFGHIVRFKDRWQMQNAYDTYVPLRNQCTNGFEIDGNANDMLGVSVAVGDVNGDGYNDLIIGAPGVRFSGKPGTVYVVFGGPTGIGPSPFAVSSLNGTNGFKIVGDGSGNGSYFGYSVAVGDINGDGIQDIIVGTGSWCASTSYAYVIFGSRSSWSASYTMPTSSGSGLIDGTKGFRLSIPMGAPCSPGYVGAGDINGDGYDDIFLSNPYSTLGDGSHVAGSVYVVFGWPKGGTYATHWPYSSSTTTALMDGTNGFRIDGYIQDSLNNNGLDAYVQWGNTYNGSNSSLLAGDVNGDGVKDLIIPSPNWGYGASGANTKSGAMYVVFGQKMGAAYASPWPYTHADTTPSGTIINGTNGFQLTANFIYQQFASNLAIGDVNSDGIADILIGSVGIGSSYVIFGHSTAWATTANVQSLTNSVVFPSSNNAWYSTVAAGDINGDGINDVIITLGNDAWVYYGLTSGWPSSVGINPSVAPSNPFDGTHGFQVTGFGLAPLWAKDITGDGKADLIFGNNFANSSAGAVYGIYGKTSWLNTQTLSSQDH